MVILRKEKTEAVPGVLTVCRYNSLWRRTKKRKKVRKDKNRAQEEAQKGSRPHQMYTGAKGPYQTSLSLTHQTHDLLILKEHQRKWDLNHVQAVGSRICSVHGT